MPHPVSGCPAAAAAEFAARGFAGANVDRIARAARVNKAMIYYHFKSKAALYREILRDMFDAVAAASPTRRAPPADRRGQNPRLRRGDRHEAEARPHFPPSGSAKSRTAAPISTPRPCAHMRGVVGALGRIVEEGVEAGVSDKVNPLLVHAGSSARCSCFSPAPRCAGARAAGVPARAHACRATRSSRMCSAWRLMALEGRTA